MYLLATCLRTNPILSLYRLILVGSETYRG